jgi:hypothetical protein
LELKSGTWNAPIAQEAIPTIGYRAKETDLGGDSVAKKKDTEITIVDRNAPRVAIQITEISVDAKSGTRRRQSVAHLTVTNLSGDEAKRIIVKAIEKASGK